MLDPIEQRKFNLLVRGMLPAPFIYVAVAWAYLAVVDSEAYFGTAPSAVAAVAVGVAAPVWAFVTYRIALARGRTDARLAQTLLTLAHGPGIAGFVLAVGADQLWYTFILGAEALAGLLIVRSKVGR